jgi:recombination associated protein RdgC
MKIFSFFFILILTKIKIIIQLPYNFKKGVIMSKWYSSLFAYKLNTKVTEQDLSSKIEDFKITEMSEGDRTTHGWDYVIGESELYCNIQGVFSLNLRIDKKTVPAAALKKKVNERVKQMEAQGSEKVNKKAVKEQVEGELMKHAFISDKFIQGYIDPKNELLVINSNSNSDIEIFVDYLRETLSNDLDIDLIEVEFDITETITKWVKEKEAKEPFEIGEACTLYDSLTGSKASFSGQDLGTDEIDVLLNSGKNVSELSLIWDERVSLSLNNEFKIKKIKPQDIINEIISGDVGEDDNEYTEYVTSMHIMISDFAQILKDLLKED